VRKQKGKFRLVLSDGDRHALITSVTVHGLDYYVVERFVGGNELRQSLHEHGQSHTYVLGDRPIPASQGKPMREFAGIRSVWGSSLNAVSELRDWSYRPSPDRPHRRLNLLVPIDALLPMSSVDVWLVQGGRDAELKAEWARRYDHIVASAEMAWVEPQVAVVVSATTRLPPGAFASVHLSGRSPV
jgi:hypothetical protein